MAMTEVNDAERALALTLLPNWSDTSVRKQVIQALASAKAEGYRQGQEEMRAALEAADYYINRLEAAALRKVVRDMTEAMEGYRTARARTRALPITGPDNAR